MRTFHNKNESRFIAGVSGGIKGTNVMKKMARQIKRKVSGAEKVKVTQNIKNKGGKKCVEKA